MIVIDQNKCIGCGLCVSLCSGNFKFNDQLKAEVVNQGQVDSCAQEAIDYCPAQAITQQ